MFDPRPPSKDFSAPEDGRLFGVHLHCNRLDMLLSIVVGSTKGGDVMEVEAIDPAWTPPAGRSEIARLAAMRERPAPLWVERVRLAPASFASLARQMRELGAYQLEHVEVEGLIDGWTLEAVIVDPRIGRRTFSTRSPTATERTQHLQFVQQMLAFARRHAGEEKTHRALAKWREL